MSQIVGFYFFLGGGRTEGIVSLELCGCATKTPAVNFSTIFYLPLEQGVIQIKREKSSSDWMPPTKCKK